MADDRASPVAATGSNHEALAAQVTNESEPNDNFSTANPITGTSAVRGTIPIAGDVDVYTLNVTRGDNVLLNVSRFGQEFGLFGVALANSDADLVGSLLVDESSTGNLTIPIEEPGQYYVVVASASAFECPTCSAPAADGTGSYSLSVETIPNLTDGENVSPGAELEPNEEVDLANPIQSGQVVTAELSNETDLDWFRINVSRGQTLRIDVARAGGTGSMLVVVGSPEGRAIAAARVSAGERTTLVVPADRINSTGPYSVIFGPDADDPGTGRYAFVASTGRPVAGSVQAVRSRAVVNASRG